MQQNQCLHSSTAFKQKLWQPNNYRQTRPLTTSVDLSTRTRKWQKIKIEIIKKAWKRSNTKELFLFLYIQGWQGQTKNTKFPHVKSSDASCCSSFIWNVKLASQSSQKWIVSVLMCFLGGPIGCNVVTRCSREKAETPTDDISLAGCFVWRK